MVLSTVYLMMISLQSGPMLWVLKVDLVYCNIHLPDFMKLVVPTCGSCSYPMTFCIIWHMESLEKQFHQNENLFEILTTVLNNFSKIRLVLNCYDTDVDRL